MADKSNFRAGRDNAALSENVELLTGQRGDGLDRAITLRELNRLGLASLSRIGGIYTSKNGTVPGSATPGVVDFPGKPLNVLVNGAFNTILIQWDEPNYRGHAYTEVWRAETDNLAVAVMIGTSSARMYSDPIGGDAHVYYWVRFVNKNDTKGPYNSTAGTYGETAVDIGQLLDALTNQITSSQLTTELLTPIQQVPGLATSLSTETLNRINADANMASNITTLQAYTDGDLTNLFLNPNFEINKAHGFNNQALVTADDTTGTCPASRFCVLSARDNTGKRIAVTPGDVYSLSMNCYASSANAPTIGIGLFITDKNNNAIAWLLADTRSAALSWDKISGNITIPANAAYAQFWVQLSYFPGDLYFWYVTGLTWTNGNATKSVVASVQEEQTVRAAADSANASAIQTVQTNLNGTNATVSTLSSSVSYMDANGSAAYRAMWAVKGSVGNITAGIGLMVSGGVSQVMISASQFFVFDPNGAAPTQALLAVSNGAVVIRKALIEAATIETVTAMSITADYVVSGISITTPAIVGGSLSLGSGDASLYASGGALAIGKGGAYSGWGYGWHTIIYSDGSLYTDRLYASAGSFTGTVNANAGTFNNVTINSNCDVKGTIYADKIVGDVVAIKNYNIPARSSVQTTTLLSGTVLSHTKNRLMMFTDIRITRFSTVQKTLQVSIYVDGVQVWHGQAGSATDASYTANPPPLSIASGANRTFSVSVYTSDNSYLDIPAQDIQCTVVPASSGTFA